MVSHIYEVQTGQSVDLSELTNIRLETLVICSDDLRLVTISFIKLNPRSHWAVEHSDREAVLSTGNIFSGMS